MLWMEWLFPGRSLTSALPETEHTAPCRPKFLMNESSYRPVEGDLCAPGALAEAPPPPTPRAGLPEHQPLPSDSVFTPRTQSPVTLIHPRSLSLPLPPSVPRSLTQVSQLLPVCQAPGVQRRAGRQAPVPRAASAPICAPRACLAGPWHVPTCTGAGPGTSPALCGHMGEGGRGERWTGSGPLAGRGLGTWRGCSLIRSRFCAGRNSPPGSFWITTLSPTP